LCADFYFFYVAIPTSIDVFKEYNLLHKTCLRDGIHGNNP